MIRQWMQDVGDELVMRVRSLPNPSSRLIRVCPGEFELRDVSSVPDFIQQMIDRYPDAQHTPKRVVEFLLRHDRVAPPDWNTLGTPKLRESVLPYQRANIDRVISELFGRAFLKMDMGTGKSLVSAAVAAYYGGMALVLASALEQWKDEFGMWTHMRVRIVKGSEARLEPTDEVVVTTYKTLMLNPHLQNARWTTVIVDESHNIGGNCATNSAAVRVCARAKSALMVSGTTMKARPRELFNQLKALHPHVFPNREEFEARYCDGGIGRWGYYEANGATNAEELKAVIDRMCVTANKEEVLKDLPPITVHDVDVPVAPEIVKRFKELDKQWNDLTKEIESAPAHLKKGIKLKRDALSMAMYRECGTVKAPFCISWLLEFLRVRDPTEKVVVFAYNVDVIESTSEALTEAKIGHVKITGDTPGDKRHALLEGIRDPQNTKTRVAVLTLGTSATSLNLQGANIVVMFQLSQTPGLNDQAMGRVHRKGATKPIDVYRLIARGTDDDKLLKNHEHKLRTIDRIFKKARLE